MLSIAQQVYIFWLVFLHILIQKYLGIFPINFVRLYNSHLKQSRFLCSAVIISGLFVHLLMLSFEGANP